MKRIAHLPALLVIFVSFAYSQQFTLEQILSAPFSDQLVAAKGAPRIAWASNIRGERNVYVASVPDYKPRQATHYAGDTGQPIAALAITPDGKTLVYARGTEIDEVARAANPKSLVEQPKQQVWSVSADGGEPKLLGEMGCSFEGCEDIEISPDGKWAVWATKKELWVAPVDGSAKAASQLTDIRGDVSQPRWSPDGARIVFKVDRGNHALIAIADLEMKDGHPSLKELHWIAPSADRDTEPRWSHDGRQVAFLRTPGAEVRVPLIPDRVRQWSIWVGDTASYHAKQIWKSGSASRDSLPEFASAGFYFAGDRVVFVSEKDGWPHLYSIPTSGGDAALLTPGEFSIEQVALSSDEKSLTYSSNQGNLDSRHIWRVAVAGGTPQPISRGEGFEWSPALVANGDVVALGSSANMPGLPYKLTSNGRQLLAADLLPKEFPAQQLLTPKVVTFPSTDGLTIHGQLFMPKQCETAKCPALIFTHGGPSRQMWPAFHYMDYYAGSYEENQYLASRGYVVLSVNYRLGIMYGHDFQHPAHAVWRGASEYNDVVAGAHYLQSLPQVDPQRMGLWGGSYGGFLTAMGLARNSDTFKAGVDYHGVHDWSVFLGEWEEGANTAPDLKDAIALAIKSSPIGSMESWRSPVLLIHGDDDRNVPFGQTTDLVQRLKKQNVQYDEMILPDEIHDLLLWHNFINSYRATGEYFDRYLKSQQ